MPSSRLSAESSAVSSTTGIWQVVEVLLQATRHLKAIHAGSQTSQIIQVRVVGTRLLQTGLPVGLGEPVFDKLDAQLSKGIMSIGAVKQWRLEMDFLLLPQTGARTMMHLPFRTDR